MSDWTDFMKGKMGPYMKKYGSHGAAIRALSRDFKKQKAKKSKLPNRTMMARKKNRKQSNISLKREISKLKKLKKVDAERKKLFAARAKEIEEIRELRAEARQLKGVGSKRRIAGGLALTGGKFVGKHLLKGLKAAGRIAKARLEAEAREQARDAARAKSKTKTKRRKN